MSDIWFWATVAVLVLAAGAALQAFMLSAGGKRPRSLGAQRRAQRMARRKP